MGGASARDVKNRIRSVESTMHITKAMELVASSKLKKAKERMENSRAFFTALYETLCDIANYNNDFSSVFVRERPVQKVCFVVVAGDRGLAGGYNSNVFRKVREREITSPYCVVPIGKKALEFYNATPKSLLEKAEENDMMRFVENDHKVHAIVSPYKTISVNTPKDRVEVEEILKQKGFAHE